MIGPAIETQVGDLLAAHAALAGPLPDSLQLGTIRVSHRGDERSRVVTYLDTDALELPTALLDLLPRFDGRPTGAVLAELRGLGVEVSPPSCACSSTSSCSPTRHDLLKLAPPPAISSGSPSVTAHWDMCMTSCPFRHVS
ncbi:hypothetical protein [Nannocystis pusilla]|uniref:hypothetical protein n=1 Tax=Nannocystis pusilla TaxID=889268 RepID=UPI003B779391